MSDARDQASSELDDLEVYIQQLEEKWMECRQAHQEQRQTFKQLKKEWKQAKQVYLYQKETFNQISEDDEEVYNSIVSECDSIINGGGFDPNKIDDWVVTARKHVWYSPSLNKFVYSDEASQFDTTAYDTQNEAENALNDYVRKYL